MTARQPPAPLSDEALAELEAHPSVVDVPVLIRDLRSSRAEVAALRAALSQAAGSLCTASKRGVVADDEVRGYTFSRAGAALAALHGVHVGEGLKMAHRDVYGPALGVEVSP